MIIDGAIDYAAEIHFQCAVRCLRYFRVPPPPGATIKPDKRGLGGGDASFAEASCRQQCRATMIYFRASLQLFFLHALFIADGARRHAMMMTRALM